jgi:spore coat protein U-like protein
MKRRFLLVPLLLAACFAPLASAATCTVAGTNIQFGSFSGTTINMSGTLTIKCPSGKDYQVGIDAGTGSGATTINRLMTGPGGALLGYELFSDAGHTSNWGNTSGTGWVTGTGTSHDQTLTVFAQLPSNEYAPAGSYTDATVTVTLSGAGVTTVTSPISINTTVAVACNIAANPLNFGAYSGLLTNATSTIFVTCTNSTAYNVGLDTGTATGATVTNRSMTGPGGALLGYTLFRDSAHTSNWGNTVGTDTISGTGTGAAQSLTVYGQIPAGQYVTPGSYADTIIATVTY